MEQQSKDCVAIICLVIFTELLFNLYACPLPLFCYCPLRV
uniref:Uncharacterized protein n=1 Tax=Arundo donax TaxID=35708 RepID=A0A0A9AU40_ARUDO